MFRYAWRRFKFGMVATLLLLAFLFPGHELLLHVIQSAAAQTGALGTTVIASPTGSEIVTVAGTGPQIQSLTTNQLRNANNYQLQGGGVTVTITANPNAAKFIVTAAITTLNLTFPIAPADGQTFEVSCPGGAATTVAMTATAPAGVTISGTAFTACAAGGAAANTAEWIYGTATNIWYRIQ